MTTAEAVKTLVTYSLAEDCTNLDDLPSQTSIILLLVSINAFISTPYHTSHHQFFILTIHRSIFIYTFIRLFTVLLIFSPCHSYNQATTSYIHHLSVWPPIYPSTCLCSPNGLSIYLFIHPCIRQSFFSPHRSIHQSNRSSIYPAKNLFIQLFVFASIKDVIH